MAKPNLSIWFLVIAGLVLLNLGVIVTSFSTIQLYQMLFYLHPIHWEISKSVQVFLWLSLVFLGVDTILLNILKKTPSDNIVSIRRNFDIAAIVTLICVTLYYTRFFMKIQSRLYSYIYVPYVYAPLTEFMLNGKISWKLAITPTLALIVILYLLRLQKQINNSVQKHQTQGDGNDKSKIIDTKNQ